jgi:hypothetical protein
MSSVRTVTRERPTGEPAVHGESLYRVALWALLASKLVTGWGVQWDIQWHLRIGRDSFWIAPHVMTYAGVALAVLISFGVLARDTAWRLGTGRDPAGTIRLLGLTGTPGFHLAAWGIALTVLAAPIDDLWHRLFGLDVTIWSPPHLLGLLGAAVNTLACLLIAREAYSGQRWMRDAGVILAAASLFGTLAVGLQPAIRIAYLYGGVWFYTYPMLAVLILPLALVGAARLSDRRWAPLAVMALVLVIGMIGTTIAHVGFEFLQPVSVIDEEIAKDPTSPIAVTNEIARKNGTTPGSPPGGRLVHLLAFVPVLLLVAPDPRRRPALATLAYAVGVFVMWRIRVGGTPAFQSIVPGPEAAVIALLLTLGLALVGAVAARGLADALVLSGPSDHEARPRATIGASTP